MKSKQIKFSGVEYELRVEEPARVLLLQSCDQPPDCFSCAIGMPPEIWRQLVLFADQNLRAERPTDESFAQWYEENVEWLGEDARDDVRAAFMAGTRYPWFRLCDQLVKIGELANQYLPKDQQITDPLGVLPGVTKVLAELTRNQEKT